MIPSCRDDLQVCIDFIVLSIGDFLTDWTTLAMLAILLGLLLRLRVDRQRAREAAYASRLQTYDRKRAGASPGA
jgi:hypothetical protein